MFQLLSFIVLIGSVVFIHELGHYLAARMCGVGVLKFSLGFGPTLWRKEYKGTEYRIGILPFGGYVRMVGDMPDLITGKQATDDEVRSEELIADRKTGDKIETQEVLSPEALAMIADKSQWFIHKGYWPKAFIVFAGPLFNFLLAYFIAVSMALFIGLADTDGTKLGKVIKDSPAEKAGLLEGDEIKKIDGKEAKDFSEIQKVINGSQGRVINFEVNRNNSLVNLSVTPQKKSFKIPGEENIETYMVGISAATIVKKVPPGEALIHSSLWLFRLGKSTLFGIFDLAQGDVPLDSIGGPVMMYHVAGAKAEKGLGEFLGLLAYINLSLGLLNLLPIPVLDGGHLVIFTLEAIFGTFSVKKKEFVQAFGFLILISLMIVAFRNDILRDNAKMLKSEPSWNDE